MPDALPELLTVEEAARLIRVGRTKAYAMTQEWRATGGRSGLPVVDFGNVLRVPRQALERLIGTAASTVTEPSEPARPDVAPVSGPAPPISAYRHAVGSGDGDREGDRRVTGTVTGPHRSGPQRRHGTARQSTLFDAVGAGDQ